MIDGIEVSRHNTKRSCWIVLDSRVFDVTSFLKEHPGGESVLMKQAGADATAEFRKVHPPEYAGDLPPGSYLGDLDPATAKSLRTPHVAVLAQSPHLGRKAPQLSLCVRADDFETAAKSVLDRKAWVYVSSSSNSGLSLRGNLDDWSRITFRPRVLRNVESISTESSILGHATVYPFFASAMGTLGVAHVSAEPELVKAVVRKGLHGVISTASTRTAGQIMRGFDEEQRKVNGASPSKLFFQFYIPTERSKAIEIIEIAKRAGYKGLWITVDLPVLGKRTADKRLQAEEALLVGESEESATDAVDEEEEEEENPFTPGVGGRVVAGRLSARTTWEDLGWIRDAWQGPIVIKGIQCVDDAKLAMEYGCQGVVLSNHGGRQLHTAPSSLMTLLEIRTYCPEVLEKLEVYVDGGLRDGADVLKAICLGAKSVGVGRPFFYAMAAYGASGVERCIDILGEELATAMRLVGITSLDQARPEMVNASRLLNEMWRPEGRFGQSRL